MRNVHLVFARLTPSIFNLMIELASVIPRNTSGYLVIKQALRHSQHELTFFFRISSLNKTWYWYLYSYIYFYWWKKTINIFN